MENFFLLFVAADNSNKSFLWRQIELEKILQLQCKYLTGEREIVVSGVWGGSVTNIHVWSIRFIMNV
jgi:hypothetical protein